MSARITLTDEQVLAVLGSIEPEELPEIGPDWPRQWSLQIGRTVQTLRKARRMSARALSERCAEVGFPIPQSTITNLENGRKESVPVHEAAVLSTALGVPLFVLIGADS